jgi:hypothetical protein
MNSQTDPIIKLTFDECWELPSADIAGRLAPMVESHPEISPVNYIPQRRSIVFRSAGGNTRTTDPRRASVE